MIRRLAARLRRDERGVSIIEFALFSVPLLISIMAGIELGYRVMVISNVEGAVKNAARLATTGNYTPVQIDAAVDSSLSGLNNLTITTTKKSYKKFSQVGKPEPITSDTAPVGVYNPGDCFEDINNNGSFDADGGVNDDIGGAQEIVQYTATAEYDTLFPFLVNMLGFDSKTRVSSSTIMQNEPWAAASSFVPATVCS